MVDGLLAPAHNAVDGLWPPSKVVGKMSPACVEVLNALWTSRCRSAYEPVRSGRALASGRVAASQPPPQIPIWRPVNTAGALRVNPDGMARQNFERSPLARGEVLPASHFAIPTFVLCLLVDTDPQQCEKESLARNTTDVATGLISSWGAGSQGITRLLLWLPSVS